MKLERDVVKDSGSLSFIMRSAGKRQGFRGQNKKNTCTTPTLHPSAEDSVDLELVGCDYAAKVWDFLQEYSASFNISNVMGIPDYMTNGKVPGKELCT